MSLVFWPGSLYTRGYPAILEAAAAGDYAYLAISPAMVSQVRAAGLTDATILDIADDNGVRLSHLDGVSSWVPVWYPADPPPGIRDRFDFPARECLDMASELDLTTILLTAAFDRGAVAPDVIVTAFAAFCDAAAGRGLRVELDFVPYWGIPDLTAAWDVVREANRANSGLVIDTWSLSKGSPDLAHDLDLLATIDADRLRTLQLADGIGAQWTDSLYTDERLRRFPGEGDFDVERIAAVVASRGGLTTVGTEIFGAAIDALTPAEAGRLSRRATDQVLRRVSDHRSRPQTHELR
jgi:sugar phosphate isomerase/epimerase